MTMTQLSPSLRKAAVLISALDEDAADSILQQMSAEDAAKVRSALMELTDISADEQQQVLAEFLRRQGAPSVASVTNDDVALELDPAVEAAAADFPTSSRVSSPPSDSGGNAFAFLEHVEPKAIALVLIREHPQTAAVVVAQLNPQHAAAVLQELPADLATDALERIAWLEELSPEIQADLAAELRQQLAPHIKTAAAGTGSLAQVSAVIGAMGFRQRERVLLQLGQRNTPLVNRLGLFPPGEPPSTDRDNVVALRYRLDSEASSLRPATLTANVPSGSDPHEPWLAFDDLLLLDDAGLRAVFAAADTDLALLALTGAESRLIARILRKLPAESAAVLRRRLEHPGPVRLRDIEQARSALAAIATRLAHDGMIRLPPSARFAAAI